MSEFEGKIIDQVTYFLGCFKGVTFLGLIIFMFKDFSTKVSVKVNKDEVKK